MRGCYEMALLSFAVLNVSDAIYSLKNGELKELPRDGASFVDVLMDNNFFYFIKIVAVTIGRVCK